MEYAGTENAIKKGNLAIAAVDGSRLAGGLGMVERTSVCCCNINRILIKL
jgi:hypothetical protein